MPGKRFFIGLGTAVFLCGLILQAPASLIGPALPSEVKVAGISGSIWNGKSRGVTIGDLRFYEANWSINPLYLFMGSLKATFNASGQDAEISGNLRASVFGTLNVNDLRGFVGLGSLKGMLDIPVNGTASLQLKSFSYSDNWIDAVVGNVEVRNLTFFDPMNKADIAIGNYELSFDTPDVPDNGIITGNLIDTGGPLKLTGTIELSPPNSYALSADVKPEAGADAGLRQGLNMMAPPTAGVHQLRISSSF